MESKITQNPLPPPKNKNRTWEGQKFEKNKVDHMVSGEATHAEFALQAYFDLFIFWTAGLASRKAEHLHILLRHQNRRIVRQASRPHVLLRMNPLVCLTIPRTLTFLNLVTEKVNLFPSCYAPCCSVHSYNF